MGGAGPGHSPLIMIIGVVRGVLTGVWVVAFLGCLALVVFSRTSDAVIVAGGSMEPGIPRGSLIAPDAAASADLGPGDVVTVRASNGVLVTHRISRILALADGTFLELRGDANARPDPALVPALFVVGRVEWHLPHAGFLLGLLSTPLGLLSIVSLLASTAFGIWLVEDLTPGAGARAPVGPSRAVTR